MHSNEGYASVCACQQGLEDMMIVFKLLAGYPKFLEYGNFGVVLCVSC